MDNKSTTLLLISLSAIAFLTAYTTGLLDWMLDYSAEVVNDIVDLFRNMVELIALLAYTYFGIRFFNRFVRNQV